MFSLICCMHFDAEGDGKRWWAIGASDLEEQRMSSSHELRLVMIMIDDNDLMIMILEKQCKLLEKLLIK